MSDSLIYSIAGIAAGVKRPNS